MKNISIVKNVHIFPKIICVYENFVVILHSEKKEMNIFMSEFTPPMLQKAYFLQIAEKQIQLGEIIAL